MSAEEWDAPEGGLFNDVAGNVADAQFKVNPEYDGVELYLDIKPDDGQAWDEETGMCQVRAAAGPGWDLVDSAGSAIVHEQDAGDKLKKINGNTQYGYLVNSVRDEDGAREVMGKRGSPRNAGVWIGLHVGLERVVTGTFTPAGETEAKEVRRWKVVQLSEAIEATGGTGAKAAASNGSTGNITATADAPAGTTGAAEFPGTAAIKVKLKILAAANAEQNAFVEAALVNVPEVAEAGALQDWVIAEGSREMAAAL